MSLKFCPNCGDKLDSDQKFCANCGYDLTDIQGEQNDETVYTQQSEPQEPEINVDVPAPFPINGSGGLNRDYKENRVTQYKRLMGMDTGVQNTVVGEAYKGLTIGISGAIAELKASWFILSFEDDGLVLIGVDKVGHFNEKNGCLSNDRIQTVKVHKGLGKKTLVFKTFSGDSLQFYINFALAGCPYQRQNYKNLANLVSKYNK